MAIVFNKTMLEGLNETELTLIIEGVCEKYSTMVDLLQTVMDWLIYGGSVLVFILFMVVGIGVAYLCKDDTQEKSVPDERLSKGDTQGKSVTAEPPIPDTDNKGFQMEEMGKAEEIEVDKAVKAVN